MPNLKACSKLLILILDGRTLKVSKVQSVPLCLSFSPPVTVCFAPNKSGELQAALHISYI